MKKFIFVVVLFSVTALFGTNFVLNFDTNWPNIADEECSGTPSANVNYKLIDSPYADTHLVGVDSEVLSNGNYLVLSQIYSGWDCGPINPSRYYLSVINQSNGSEIDNYYISSILLNQWYELFDIEKIPGQTNSFLIVGKYASTVFPNPTNYRVFVAKITVNTSNIISVAWSQNINSSTTDKAGYSVTIKDSKVYIGGHSGLYGTVLKADLTSTGLTNVTTLYNCIGLSSNCVIKKVKFDEDLENLLVSGGYSYSRLMPPSSGSVSFLYEMDETNGSIVDSYTRNDVYSDHIRMTNFAYNYASNMLMFSEIENGENKLYDVKTPFGTPVTAEVTSPAEREIPLSMDTIYHNNDDAVFVDIDHSVTYLRADKNLDRDFTDQGEQVLSLVNSWWQCDGAYKGSFIWNAHIKIIDSNELLSVGCTMGYIANPDPETVYPCKLFVQKSFYN